MICNDTHELTIRYLGLGVLIAGFLAMGVNLAIVYGARWLFGASLMIEAPDGNGMMTWPVRMMLPESFVVAAAAAMSLWCMVRFISRPLTVFAALGMTIALASMAGPWSQPTDTATRVALSLTHLVLGVINIGVFSFVGRTRL